MGLLPLSKATAEEMPQSAQLIEAHAGLDIIRRSHSIELTSREATLEPSELIRAGRFWFATTPYIQSADALFSCDFTQWFISCGTRVMLTLNCFSQMRWERGWRLAYILPVLFVVPQLCAGSELSTQPQTSPQSVAFGRYLESLEHGSPLDESGPIAVLVQASIPGLYKESALLAVRRMGSNERSEFQILGIGGDGAVLQEVIARYFAIQEQMENLPRSSILITPENYRFQFRGQVRTGGGSAYVYDITPKKRRAGLCKGQIWIDAASGTELLVSGDLADTSSMGSIAFVRETNLDASGYTRVTHLTFAVPLIGRSELMVTESPAASASDLPTLQNAPQHSSQGALGRAQVY